MSIAERSRPHAPAWPARLVAGALFGALAAFAAAEDAAPTDAGPASERSEPDARIKPTEETPREADEDKAEQEQTLADVFSPSEEISEDIAVPFPVDI